MDLKAKAARAKGLNTPATMRSARPGAVYKIVDRSVAFPKERLPGAPARSLHRTRYAVIVQAHLLCTAADPITVYVVPCSSSSGKAGAGDYEVPDDESVFPEKTVAYTTLMQPVLKAELDSYVGDLRPQTLLALQSRILQNLGILGQGTIDLQPQTVVAPPVPGQASSTAAVADDVEE